MRRYNVYYHTRKINKRPVDKEVIDKLYEREFIFKHDPTTNKTEKFPVSDLKIIQCIVV